MLMTALLKASLLCFCVHIQHVMIVSTSGEHSRLSHANLHEDASQHFHHSLEGKTNEVNLFAQQRNEVGGTVTVTDPKEHQGIQEHVSKEEASTELNKNENTEEMMDSTIDENLDEPKVVEAIGGDKVGRVDSEHSSKSHTGRQKRNDREQERGSSLDLEAGTASRDRGDPIASLRKKHIPSRAHHHIHVENTKDSYSPRGHFPHGPNLRPVTIEENEDENFHVNRNGHVTGNVRDLPPTGSQDNRRLARIDNLRDKQSSFDRPTLNRPSHTLHHEHNDLHHNSLQSDRTKGYFERLEDDNSLDELARNREASSLGYKHFHGDFNGGSASDTPMYLNSDKPMKHPIQVESHTLDEHPTVNREKTNTPSSGPNAYGLPPEENESEKGENLDGHEPGDSQYFGVSGIEADVDENEPNGVDLGQDKKNSPQGPIAVYTRLKEEYGGRFTDEPEANVPWQEPEMLTNCWAQAMLARHYMFSPNCNKDGSFAPKQCFLERCWCVNRDGTPQNRSFKHRFHYLINGILLECSQNGQ